MDKGPNGFRRRADREDRHRQAAANGCRFENPGATADEERAQPFGVTPGPGFGEQLGADPCRIAQRDC